MADPIPAAPAFPNEAAEQSEQHVKYNWHGLRLADKGLPPPACTFRTTQVARKDCGTGIDGSEYEDSIPVLETKAELFIKLCKGSKTTAILTGAGLSRSSGIRDYASKSGATPGKKQPLTTDFIWSCRPTIAHRVLVAIHKGGHLPGLKPYTWTEQNHDLLEIRAGLQIPSNPIHGSWQDTWYLAKKDNPVVPMSGQLRTDLFEYVEKTEQQMDICLSIGTSHSGLNVDRLISTACERYVDGKGLGGVMCTLQKTPYDNYVGLRVFARCDTFFAVVAKKLGLYIDLDTDYNPKTKGPIKYRPDERSETMKTFANDPYFAPLFTKTPAPTTTPTATPGGRTGATAAASTGRTTGATAASSGSRQTAAPKAKTAGEGVTSGTAARTTAPSAPSSGARGVGAVGQATQAGGAGRSAGRGQTTQK